MWTQAIERCESTARNRSDSVRAVLWLALTVPLFAFAAPVAAQELLANGDFEAGASGWAPTDAYVNVPGSAPTSITTSTTGPLSGLPVPGPNAGVSYALFDNSGPTTQALVQSFAVPIGTKSLTLSFALAIADWSGVGPLDAGGLDHTLANNQHMRVDILTAGAGPFDTGAAVVSNLFLSVGAPLSAYGDQVHDLSGVLTAGTPYQLRFGSAHNQGYLTIGVDDASLFASPALCGDGIPDPGEDCDDAGESVSCDADCTFAVCGDATLNATSGESCDDGDGNDNNDCTNACLFAACGDGVTWNEGTGNETCDDGDSINENDCTNACEAAICGDGLIWNLGTGTETCDDADGINENDCTNACEAAICGDGLVWNLGTGTETCDDADSIDENDCTNACEAAICGDGLLWNLGTGSETCDDGGTADGDGCSGVCQNEPPPVPLLQSPIGWGLALLLMTIAAAAITRERKRAEAGRSRGTLWLRVALLPALAQLGSGTAHAQDFSVDVVEDVLHVCQPDYAAVTTNVATTGETSVTLSVSGTPVGVVVNATPTTLGTLPGSSAVTLGATGTAAPGAYPITVTGTGASGVAADAFTWNLTASVPGLPTLLSPADAATGVALAPTLAWSADPFASSFAVEVASDPLFANVVHSNVVATNSETVPALNPGTTYSWRVGANNACGVGAFTSGQSFTTTTTVCAIYVSSDVPKTIPTVGSVTSTLTVAGAQPSISDVNVTLLGTHARVGDIAVSLESPQTTSVAIADFAACGSDTDFDLSLDDAAALPIPCPPTGAGVHLPTNALSAYSYDDPNGTWTLSITDSVAANGGQLDAWSVEICAGLVPPLIDTVSTIDPVQLPDQVEVVAIDIDNIGGEDLVWTLDEADDPGLPSFGSVLPPSHGAFARGSHPPSLGLPPAPPRAPSAAGAVSLGETGLAYATEGITSVFTSFDLATPATVSTITSFADTVVAGDFGMDEALYFQNRTTGNLERMTTAGARTVIGPSAPQLGQNWVGLALDPTTGTMYATSTSCGSSSELYTLDLVTGTATLVDTVTNAPCLIALAIDDAGDAWSYDIANDQLLSIDLANGAGTIIGSIGFDANFAQGLDWDSDSGQLYMAAFNNATFTAQLRSVNTTTGNTTLVGQIGQGVLVFGFLAIENPPAPTSNCASVGDTPWLSATPTNGTTLPAGTSSVDVTFDSTGLAAGTYESALCINSNDPTAPLVEIPLTLTVNPAIPIIDLNPTTLTSTQAGDTIVIKALDVGNIGYVDLSWVIDEEPALFSAEEGEVSRQREMEAAIERLASEAGSVTRVTRERGAGAANFVRFERNAPLTLAGATPVLKAQTFFARHGASFGLQSAASDLVMRRERRDRHGFTHLEFEQRYEGLPVFGGGLRLHFDASDRLRSAHGRLLQDIAVDPIPEIGALAAAAIAKWIVLAQPTSDGAAKHSLRGQLQLDDLTIHDVRLMVFRAGLLQGSPGRVHLAYRVEVREGTQLREFVFIDAHRGKLVERYTGIHNALFRRLYEANLGNEIWTEGDAFPGALDSWQQNEIVAAGHAYNFFDNAFGHVSYDGADAEMWTINNNPAISCPNASWNGLTANYCTGTASDDVVAHEWGHAYTEYTNGLIYAWQTGALNESYSDIWGETIDILNGYEDAGEDLSARAACNDTDRWRMGEDASAFGGAIRDLWDPTCNGDPGKVTDTQYWCGGSDAGGVHTNSGVPNHLYALLVDGGTYNGNTISALGFTKTAHIHWRVQSLYETNTTDFAAHADALEQACADLIGIDLEGLSTSAPSGPSGEIISTADCTEVAEAILATELRAPYCTGTFSPLLDPNAPALCGGGPLDSILLADFESGLGSFTVAQVPINPGTWDSRDWTVIGALPDGRAGSAVYGPDPVVGDCQSDLDNGVIYLQSPPIAVPGSATAPIRMRFDHYVSLEDSWDGGNLKYSTDGATWNLVPSAAFTFNAYNDTLNTAGAGNDNPMAGEVAFTGADGGSVAGSWGQSQIDLSAVGIDPGDTVHLRWELGTDGCNGWDGWYVDDVEVYSCVVACANPSDVPWLSAAPTAGLTAPSDTTPVDVTFDSTGLADGSYEASLCVTSDDPVTPIVALPVTLDVTTP